MFYSKKINDRNIISNISFIGFNENDILKYGKDIYSKGFLSCLFCFPEKETESMNNELIFDLIFPEQNNDIKYIIDFPKFFSLTLTDEYGNLSYLYCLKYSEIFPINNDEIYVPLVICIKSYKYDYDAFKNLLYIILQIIMSDKKQNLFDYECRNNCKKIELLNLFYYCFSLLKPAPHTNIKFSIKSDFLNKKDNEINFYYSSNCEIPCNENDKDISILFYTLDQSVIVKLLISILMERQIIIRSSHSNLLHLIMPAILKLIFPFKWLHSYIPVLPFSCIELLDKPGPYIFGVLSDSISFNQMMEKFPGKVVVDCDINEIFGDNNFKPYNFNKGKELIYGLNTIFLDNNSKIFRYDEKNHRKIRIDWKVNNLNIDCKNSQIMEDNEINLVDRKYFKWLRKNCQIIKNPEIFDIDNLKINKNKKENDEEENPININRPLSYNIQNIFLIFIKKLMNDKKQLFYEEFIKTNLYLSYNEIKKFENEHGKIILDNIEETKQNPRSYNNSFIVNYSIKNFPAKEFIELLKFHNNNSNKQLINIFENYIKIKKNENDLSNSKIILNDNNSLQNKCLDNNNSKNVVKNENKKKHVKNQSSVLEKTGFNHTIDIIINEKEPFLFYQENGFLSFLKEIHNFCYKNNINLNSMIINKKLEEQMIKILQDEKLISENDNNMILDLIDFSENDNNIINTNKNNNKTCYPIFEKGDEKSERSSLKEKENDNIIINTSNFGDISFMNKEEQYDAISSDKILLDKTNLNNEEQFIINFSPLNNENENFNNKLQYYLYIAFFLELFKINKENDKNILIKYSNSTLINLILKLYIKSYELGDHKDYPYFVYYSFLNNLEYEDLENISIIKEKYKDLYEIYNYVINEKNKILLKKISILNPSQRSLTLTNYDHENANSRKLFSITNDKEERAISYNNMNNQNNIIQTSKTTTPLTSSIKDENIDFMKKEIIINSYKNKIFEIHGYPSFDIYITNLPLLIFMSMPSIQDIISKNMNDLIEETNLKMQNTGIIEFISELRLFNPVKLKTSKERAVFWVNIFNSLILFSIFYKKIRLENENEWKQFFNNIYYDIGGDYYSFNDIQYILFNKLIFISNNNYTPKKHVKDCSIEEIKKRKILLNNSTISNSSNNEIINNNIYISYFSLFIPNKSTFFPKIYSFNNISEEMKEKDKEYFKNVLERDTSNNLIIPEFVFKVVEKFTDENIISNYSQYIEKDMYDFIKNKKYNQIIKSKTNWKLDLSYFKR